MKNKTNEDSVTIKNHFSGSYEQVDEIKFVDGTIWKATEITEATRHYVGSDAGDKMVGLTSGYSYNVTNYVKLRRIYGTAEA